MKTILLLAGALLLAAAVFVRTSVHSQTAPGPVPNIDPIRSEDFTVQARSRVTGGLMSPKKSVRSTYLPTETARESPFKPRRRFFYDTRSDLKMRVKDVFDSRFGRQIGASRVASVFYRLASDPYWGLRCAA
jgi:hypothetical protein